MSKFKKSSLTNKIKSINYRERKEFIERFKLKLLLNLSSYQVLFCRNRFTGKRKPNRHILGSLFLEEIKNVFRLSNQIIASNYINSKFEKY